METTTLISADQHWALWAVLLSAGEIPRELAAGRMPHPHHAIRIVLFLHQMITMSIIEYRSAGCTVVTSIATRRHVRVRPPGKVSPGRSPRDVGEVEPHAGGTREEIRAWLDRNAAGGDPLRAILEVQRLGLCDAAGGSLPGLGGRPDPGGGLERLRVGPGHLLDVSAIPKAQGPSWIPGEVRSPGRRSPGTRGSRSRRWDSGVGPSLRCAACRYGHC